MPQFAIRVFPSTDPAISQNPPKLCGLTLVGSLNAMAVRTAEPNTAVINGFFRLQEVLLPRASRQEIGVVANGQNINVDFYWLPGPTLIRPLSDMFIDFYDPLDDPDSEPEPVRSVLRLASYIAGSNHRDPSIGAVLLEEVHIPLRNGHQYLMIDGLNDPNYSGYGGYFVSQLGYVHTPGPKDTVGND